MMKELKVPRPKEEWKERQAGKWFGTTLSGVDTTTGQFRKVRLKNETYWERWLCEQPNPYRAWISCWEYKLPDGSIIQTRAHVHEDYD